jgi:hypothetical protein
MTRDLTRWNRAGLSRFRYVDGNAVTHLDELRRALAERFPEWAAVQPPAGLGPADELAERLAFYARPQGDAGVELVRALARACHVLTEHLDAYANEGYLQTATQWESVRRLVALIGYEPAPPASATTRLALDARPGAAGRVAAGLAVTYAPPAGSPVTFETLDDLDVDPELNVLRPAGHDRNPAPVTAPLVLAGRVPGLRTGDPVVLEDERTGTLEGHVVTGVREDPDRTVVALASAVGPGFVTGATVVHAVPADRLRVRGPLQGGVRPLGPTVHLRDLPVDVAAGAVVALRDGENDHLRRVLAVHGRRLVLASGVPELRLTTATAARAEALPVIEVVTARDAAHGRVPRPGGTVLVVRVPGDRTDLHGTLAAVASGGGLLELGVFHADAEAAQVVEGRVRPATTVLGLSRPGSTRVSANPQQLFVAPPWPGPYALDVPWLPGPSVEVERPKKAAAGDLVALVRGNGIAWARLGAVEVADDGSGATLRAPAEPEGRGAAPFLVSETTAFAHLGTRARLAGWTVNATPLIGTRMPLDAVPPGLGPGRRVIVRVEGDAGSARATTVADVRAASVDLAAAFPPEATYGTLMVDANVVAAGHGESAAERVAGSGDATATHQRFTLPVDDLAFVPDPAFPSGVRAAVEVTVDGRRWAQVPTLAASGPDDHHFELRLDEDGHAVLGFGDGRHGRRLPSGVDNVRARLRTGTGAAGLLSPGRLEAELRGHPRVAAVRQPLPTEGGSDREDETSLRERAPAALLTLDRAVALADFGRIAARHSRVWQAVATAGRAGKERAELVVVFIVPAGGGDPSPDLIEDLETHLRRRAPVGVDVQVQGHVRRRLWCGATVRVDRAAYDLDAVARAARAALRRELTLPRRALGAAIARSDVLRVLEAVPGVETSRCELGIARDDAPAQPPDERPARLRAQPWELIAVPEADPSPIVSAEAVER